MANSRRHFFKAVSMTRRDDKIRSPRKIRSLGLSRRGGEISGRIGGAPKGYKSRDSAKQLSRPDGVSPCGGNRQTTIEARI